MGQTALLRNVPNKGQAAAFNSRNTPQEMTDTQRTTVSRNFSLNQQQ